LDFEAALIVAVEHLMQIGHERIGFFNSGKLRQNGYGPAARAALGYERAGALNPVELRYFEMEHTQEAVAAIQESGVTAIIVGTQSGLSIPELLRAIQWQGKRIPEDLSVVCLEDEALAENMLRPLTSITFDINTAADWAAKTLINKLEGRQTDVEQVILPPKLIVRDSTMPQS